MADQEFCVCGHAKSEHAEVASEPGLVCFHEELPANPDDPEERANFCECMDFQPEEPSKAAR